MKTEIIKKIISFGDKYIEKHLQYYDKGKMLKSWWDALQFLLCHSYYQGRRDEVSLLVEEAASNILEKHKSLEPNAFFSEDNITTIRNDLIKVIGKGKIGKGRDVEMVISILRFISKLDGYNIISYSLSKIKSNKIKEHFEELQDIISIGPKIASLYMRDLVCVYALNISADDYAVLQPVDTWVRQVAHKVGIIENLDEKDSVVREGIVNVCNKLGISAIKFNQGSWYIGANSFDIVLENLDKI